MGKISNKGNGHWWLTPVKSYTWGQFIVFHKKATWVVKTFVSVLCSFSSFAYFTFKYVSKFSSRDILLARLKQTFEFSGPYTRVRPANQLTNNSARTNWEILFIFFVLSSGQDSGITSSRTAVSKLKHSPMPVCVFAVDTQRPFENWKFVSGWWVTYLKL